MLLTYLLALKLLKTLQRISVMNPDLADAWNLSIGLQDGSVADRFALFKVRQTAIHAQGEEVIRVFLPYPIHLDLDDLEAGVTTRTIDLNSDMTGSLGLSTSLMNHVSKVCAHIPPCLTTLRMLLTRLHCDKA